MKPESIEADKQRKKRAAVSSIAVFLLLQLGAAVCLGSLCLVPGMPLWLTAVFWVLAILPLVLLVPALAALKQRFCEIEKGEQYETCQY